MHGKRVRSSDPGGFWDEVKTVGASLWDKLFPSPDDGAADVRKLLIEAEISGYPPDTRGVRRMGHVHEFYVRDSALGFQELMQAQAAVLPVDEGRTSAGPETPSAEL